MEVGLFHGIMRKAFHGPTHGEGGMAWSIRAETEGCPCVPSPPVPPWKRPSFVLIKTEAKASVQSFCFLLKVGAVEPAGS